MLEFGQRAGIVRLFSHLSGLRQYLSDLFHLNCTLNCAKKTSARDQKCSKIVRELKLKKVLTHSSTTSTTCFTYSGSFYGFFKINYDSKSNRDNNLDPRSLSLSVFSDSKRTIFVEKAFWTSRHFRRGKIFRNFGTICLGEILPKNIPWQVLQFCSRQYCWHIRGQ